MDADTEQRDIIERLEVAVRCIGGYGGYKGDPTLLADLLDYMRHLRLPSPRTLEKVLRLLEDERQGYENCSSSGDYYTRGTNIAKEAALHEAIRRLHALSQGKLTCRAVQKPPRKPRTLAIENKVYRVNAVFNSDGRLFYAEPSDYFAQWTVGKRVVKAILTLASPRKKGGRA